MDVHPINHSIKGLDELNHTLGVMGASPMETPYCRHGSPDSLDEDRSAVMTVLMVLMAVMVMMMVMAWS